LRPCFLAFALAATIAVAACSGGDPASQKEPPAARTATAGGTLEEEPSPPAAAVRVVDGDTNSVVRRAVVRVARQVARSNARGVALVHVRRTAQFPARISAPRHIARRVILRLRPDRTTSVRLWRRDLQWPLYGATPARTQAHPAISLRPPFRVVWRRSLRSLLEYPAVVWEGVAYATNFRGYLTAVSMRTGRILWRRHIATTFASSPAVDPDRRTLVLTSKTPGQVTIVDMDTGKVRWRYETGPAEPSAVVANGIAYFGDATGRVYALDLKLRKARWIFSGGVKITSSPALLRGRLYFGDYAGRVFALNARSGRPIWTGSAGSRVYAAVAVGASRVFASSVFSGLSALSARTGRLLWRVPVGAYLYSAPAFYRGRVYFGTYGGVVSSADAASGRILWSRSIPGRVSGAVVVVAGVVYAGVLEGQIRGWHWRTGRTVWTFPRGEYVPVSGNGARLLMHGRAGLFAVEPRRRR
jgi:outer membrane protein assembly factor BamB